MNEDDCFKILELSNDSTEEQIKEAHRDLVHVWHPDRFCNHNQRLVQKALEKTKQINDAKDTLMALLASRPKEQLRQKQPDDFVRQKEKQTHSERFVPKYRLRSRQMDLSPLEFISQKLFILSKEGERGTWMEGWTKIKSEFVKRSEKIVCDRATGLMWQQSGSEKRVEYTEAKKIIIELNKCNFNGFNDWRLPTIEELHSLYGWGKMEPDGGEPGQEPDWVCYPFSSEFEQKQDPCWSCDQAVSGIFTCPAVGLGGQALSHKLRIEPNSQWVFSYGDDIISYKSGIIAAEDRMQEHWVRAVRTMTTATC